MERVFDPRDPQLIASVSTTSDAQNAAILHERRKPVVDYTDSREFREIRALMYNRRGVCG